MPTGSLDTANRYLRALAGNRALREPWQLRARALAVYLLVRQEQNASTLLGAIHEQLERDHPDTWREDDTTAMLVAASFRMLQQDGPAQALAARVLASTNRRTSRGLPGFAHYHDPGIAQAWAVYLMHRHFPEQAGKFAPVAIERLLEPLRNGDNSTLGSAMILLALEARGGDAQAALPTIHAVAAGGKARPIGEVAGQLRRATFDAADRALKLAPAPSTTAWYALTQNGYDRQALPAVQDQGIEIIRDYLDEGGQPVASVVLGGEVTVRLRMRALGGKVRGDVAIVDLLPGGFEPVMQLAAAHDGDTMEGAEPAAATLALPGASFSPEHVEVREDRVLLYGNLGPEMREYRYRIRAGNAGRFAVPPIFAEAMYERGVHARGAGGKDISVREP